LKLETILEPAAEVVQTVRSRREKASRYRGRLCCSIITLLD
jgi:hypothetical protein